MFCRNCGKELIGSPEFCPNCGARPMKGTSFCSNCGAPTTPLTEICPKCGARVAGKVGEKSPWGWGTLFAVAFFGGWAVCGIIAGLNWRRLGRPHLMWPTIIVTVITFIVWLFVPWPEDPSLAGVITTFASLSIAGALWLWQKGDYRAWQASHPQAQRAGWQIPVLTTVVAASIMLVWVFLPMIIGVPRTAITSVSEAGPVTPVAVGHEVTDTIDARLDVDAFSFQAKQGERYVIVTGTPPTATPLRDSYLILWYADGATVLAFNDDYGGSLNSRIKWTAETTGTFYVTVENADAISTGDYTLLIQCVSQ